MSNPTHLDPTEDVLRSGLSSWRLEYSDQHIKMLVLYRDLLTEWNDSRMNLTRIVDPAAIAAQHFIDSIAILKYCDLPYGSSLLDIGTGAGFPGLPLKILRPDLHVTLLEATAKKLQFCRAVCEKLGLDAVELVHGRAEEKVPRVPLHRYETVTARAVTELSRLIGWCAPYMKPRAGQLLALKGARAAAEIAASQPVLQTHRLTAELLPVDLPGEDRSHAIVRCRWASR